ncbi:MAG: hypothetical protein R2771_01335 [Saprospiraceae bacterium]
MLLLAGIIMVATLVISRKAKNVIKTSVDLGKSNSNEEEKFKPSLFCRYAAVKFLMAKGFNLIYSVIPGRTKENVELRFDQTPFKKESAVLGVNAPSFDLVRASVTLMLSAILISMGTNLKLPLSTTYVTFYGIYGSFVSRWCLG